MACCLVPGPEAIGRSGKSLAVSYGLSRSQIFKGTQMCGEYMPEKYFAHITVNLWYFIILIIALGNRLLSSAESRGSEGL